MIRRIIFIVFVLFLMLSVSLVFIYNKEPVTVHFGPDKSYSASSAVVLISVFVFGALLSSCIGFFLGAKLRLQNRKLSKQLRSNHDQLNAIEEARSDMALGDYDKAQSTLSKIIQRDPDNLVARIQLADTMRVKGEPREALEILEAARADDRHNAELLLLAADLNAGLGNHTAALDNVALIIKRQPKNPFALQRLVSNFAALRRLDEALEHQALLIKLVSGEDYETALKQQALLEVRRAESKHREQPGVLQAALEETLRSHREFPPALALLAQTEQQLGNAEAATRLWKRVFQITGDVQALDCCARFWLGREEPAKALAAVRTALQAKSLDPVAELHGRFYLVHLLLHLEMVEEARKELDLCEQSPAIAAAGTDLARTLAKARVLRKRNRPDEALDLLIAELASRELLPIDGLAARKGQLNGAAAIDWASRLGPPLGTTGAPAVTPRMSC